MKVFGETFSVTIMGQCFQVDNAQFNRVMGLIDAGKSEGAKLTTGGAHLGDTGYYIQPTVFADVTDNMRIAREEVRASMRWKCVVSVHST